MPAAVIAARARKAGSTFKSVQFTIVMAEQLVVRGVEEERSFNATVRRACAIYLEREPER